jgi:predicted DNA-binding transcriptional regulator YafY
MSLYGIFNDILFDMAKNDNRSVQNRISQLLGLLRSDDHWTTMALANSLEVSHRTLMRDLDELKSQGYPIESDRGRGGGIRLSGRWGIERLNISNQEVISLLISLSVTEALSPEGNDLAVKALKQKIANAFPESQRRTIIDLRKRVLIGQKASDSVLKTVGRISEVVWKRAMQAFFESKCVDIKYQDETGKLTQRKFDPHFLLLNWPVWYLLGWDFLRDDVRVMRLDRVKNLSSLNESIVRRPRSLFIQSYKEFFEEI